MNLALWLKKNGFRADQVQTFLPAPMATATAMYHSGKNPLRKITRDSEAVDIVRGDAQPPPAQGLPALPRREQLAAAARGAQAHGPRRPDRQRQAPSDPHLAAGGHGRHARGCAHAARRSLRNPAHGSAEDAAATARAAKQLALGRHSRPGTGPCNMCSPGRCSGICNPCARHFGAPDPIIGPGDRTVAAHEGLALPAGDAYRALRSASRR